MKPTNTHPDKCPITRRDFFCVIEHPELGAVPTYGGPFDSYTIPEMGGEPTEPWHVRPLLVHRFDHDAGHWVEGPEEIPMRVINEEVLDELREKFDLNELTSYQSDVHGWMLECFGTEISANCTERNHRFLEEALELVQACGCTVQDAHQLVDYVFSRPTGEKTQEVGGVMVTLAALCQAQDINLGKAAKQELSRVWTKVDQIRAKQLKKPAIGPLPSVYPDRPAASPFEPLCWLRTHQGSPDWAEDCISADGSGLLDHYQGSEYSKIGLVSQTMLHVARFHLSMVLGCWKDEADQGDGIMEEHGPIYDTAKAFLAGMPKAEEPSSVLINGYQLRTALEFVNPDGDDDLDQLETDLVITHFPNGHSGPGLYANLEEYPEEGFLFLEPNPEPDSQPDISLDGPPPARVTFIALQLVSDTEHITETTVEGWSDEQRAAAFEWAMATHHHASDNDDVIVPPRPDFTRKQ